MARQGIGWGASGGAVTRPTWGRLLSRNLGSESECPEKPADAHASPLIPPRLSAQCLPTPGSLYDILLGLGNLVGKNRATPAEPLRRTRPLCTRALHGSQRRSPAALRLWSWCCTGRPGTGTGSVSSCVFVCLQHVSRSYPHNRTRGAAAPLIPRSAG